MKKVDDFETVYDMIEHAIELAFDGRMQLKFYEFLKYRKTKKEEVDAFLHSSTACHGKLRIAHIYDWISRSN